MRISPINTLSTQNTGKMPKNTFKGAIMNNAINVTNIPVNQAEWKIVWNRLVNAVKKEPNLVIKNQKYYDEILEYSGIYAGCFNIMFHDHKMFDIPYGTRIEIANDGDKPLLSFFRLSEGPAIEFSGTEEKRYLGNTDEIDGHHYNYYKDHRGYIDFHHNGNVRKTMIATEGERYYNEDGTREYFHNAKKLRRFFKEFF